MKKSEEIDKNIKRLGPHVILQLSFFFRLKN